MTKNEQKIAILTQEQQMTNENIKILKGKFSALEREFRCYETEYRAYLKKRHQITDWFDSLYRKIMRKRPKTKRDVIRKVRKRMAKIFYRGSQI